MTLATFDSWTRRLFIIVSALDSVVERFTAHVLGAAARGEALDAHALILLTRVYAATARPDVAEALGRGLEGLLETAGEPAGPSARALQLIALAEASRVTDDPRVAACAGVLAADLRRRRPDVVADAALSVQACLQAGDVVASPTLVSESVDDLEAIVSGAYRPGEGLTHTWRGPIDPRGRLDDVVRLASALLVAYDVSSRLPYSMLAEELIQHARRAFRDRAGGGLVSSVATPARTLFELNCEAARVFGRLAALRADPAYRQEAIVAPEADYLMDAQQTLESQAGASEELGAAGAMFAVAALEIADRRFQIAD